MSWLAVLQFVGPGVIFTGVSAAEFAAYALGRFPSSPTLWYINLELFGVFQKSHEHIGAFISIANSELLLIAIPLSALALVGGFFRISLLVALASNLSCLYASFLAYVWYANACLPRGAGLLPSMSVTSSSLGASAMVCSLMLVPTFLSLCASHIQYIGLIRVADPGRPRSGSAGPLSA
jgi:hypothetical protein